jgi:DNA-binding CsgD family transcriptional regulator
MDESGYQRLVSAIYDLALAPEGWPTVLRLLGGALNCHYAAAIATTPDRASPRSLGAVGITAEDHREFLRIWHKQNLYGLRHPVREAGAIVLGRSMVPRAELVRSAMYRRYLAPRAIQEVMRLDIFHDNKRSQSISLARPWSSGPFTPEELRFARALMPHLQHAVAVQVRLRDAATVARSALGALETAQGPILLLDRRGCVVHASAEAERMLREADGLSAGATGLRAATPALSARLTSLITRAAGTGGMPGASGALSLPRPSGKPDLTLVAVPLRPGMAYPGERQPAVVLQVTDPLARAAPDRALLGEAFGLTPAEADVAADLLRGLSVGEIAVGRKRSVATVRTHLASVLAKTGTARQTELLRLLMRLPRTPGC